MDSDKGYQAMFFQMLTTDHFESDGVSWPMSMLMQIIGEDVQVCWEIWMGNSPLKWLPIAMVGSLVTTGHEQGERTTQDFICNTSRTTDTFHSTMEKIISLIVESNT